MAWMHARHVPQHQATLNSDTNRLDMRDEWRVAKRSRVTKHKLLNGRKEGSRNVRLRMNEERAKLRTMNEATESRQS